MPLHRRSIRNGDISGISITTQGVRFINITQIELTLLAEAARRTYEISKVIDLVYRRSSAVFLSGRKTDLQSGEVSHSKTETHPIVP